MTARRGSVRHHVRLEASADTVWTLLGDPARLHEWFPGIESCTVEGDQRMITTGAGLPMPEQLLVVDPVLRRLQYRITSPLFVEHLGTIDVIDLDDGTCLAVYGTDAEPAALALVIGGAARAALNGLPSVMGGGDQIRPDGSDGSDGSHGSHGSDGEDAEGPRVTGRPPEGG